MAQLLQNRIKIINIFPIFRCIEHSDLAYMQHMTKILSEFLYQFTFSANHISSAISAMPISVLENIKPKSRYLSSSL
jgi:hypothetical protein